jgi:catechol 2,3-dioxygenase-like lactoylglutathione lyase family enzyme
MAGARITEVGTVFVPVADGDAALAFYTEVLGFEKRAEFSYGDGDRWLEVAPSGGGIALALVATEGHPGGRDRTLCALSCGDIDATHAELAAKGVEVDPIGRESSTRAGLFLTEARIKSPVPPQFFFRDPDGNRFLVVGPG